MHFDVPEIAAQYPFYEAEQLSCDEILELRAQLLPQAVRRASDSPWYAGRLAAMDIDPEWNAPRLLQNDFRPGRVALVPLCPLVDFAAGGGEQARGEHACIAVRYLGGPGHGGIPDEWCGFARRSAGR